ncbi:MAG: hypothetical protein NTW87_33915 [Planctomycetota bacterium]|nr:hypothetical protein [Planctomycetota bacterium]
MHAKPRVPSPASRCSSCTAWTILALVICSALAGAETRVDGTGRLERLQLGKGWLPLQTDVRVPLKGWDKILSLADAKAAGVSNAGGKTWSAVLTDGAKMAAQVEQTFHEDAGKAVFDIKATGKGDVETEGVFFWVEVPTDHFAGGTYKTAALSGPDAQPAQSGDLPRQLPEQFRLCNTTTSQIVLADPARKSELIMSFEPAAHLLLQDGRKWTQHFAVLVDVCTGDLPKDQTAKLRITLSMAGESEATPATLVLDAATARYRLAGIGGNYCFNIESPVTRYTLDNLKVAFARTEMTLSQWEPVNDNEDPAKTDWRSLVANDLPDSRLRREFQLMAELSRKKIPFVASIWQLPAWLYTKPPTAENMNNRIVPEKWPELLECIASYLLYAKEKYAAEPDYFSFNEPNIGCRVAFNAQEHCAAVKRIGAHLAKSGLKTKMLLGDVAGPRDTIAYIGPVSLDQEALQYAGAVSFHSWGGATPAQYAAWPEAAAKLRLPLIVAEAGPDPSAWQGGRYQTFEYGMREVAHYQELFLHARPQAILLWEFTGDYSLLAGSKFDKERLRLTERFCFQKHWCDLTPAGSEALATKSDNDAVLFTAFRFKGAEPGCTLHLANTKWARPAKVEGLPPDVKTLNVVRTSKGELFKRLDPAAVVNGSLTLELPAQSLTTLTTLPVPQLAEPGAAPRP